MSNVANQYATRQPMAQPSGLPQWTPPDHGLTFPWSTVNKITTQTNSAPIYMNTMRDGNVWFADKHTGFGVGKVTPSGTVTTYAISGAQINALVPGPDGNMWAADFTSGNGVWKITYGGSATKYAIAGAVLHGICVGPDGNLYAADETTGNGVWQITTSGTVTQVSASAFSGAILSDVCVGADGNIWATNFASGGGIYKINPWTFSVTYFALGSIALYDMATGPDGNIWAAGSNTNKMYVISPWTGAILQTITLTTGSVPNHICCGPDGRMWLSMYYASGGSGMAAIDTLTYAVTNYQNASILDGGAVCVGADGQMWLADYNFGTGTGAIYTSPFVSSSPGVNSFANAAQSSPSFVSGTALQINANQDVMLYVTVTTASTIAIAWGPTSSTTLTLVPSVAATVGCFYSARVPAGWYVKITGTIADLTIEAVTC
jgi:streptogramin lyase